MLQDRRINNTSPVQSPITNDPIDMKYIIETRLRDLPFSLHDLNAEGFGLQSRTFVLFGKKVSSSGCWLFQVHILQIGTRVPHLDHLIFLL